MGILWKFIAQTLTALGRWFWNRKLAMMVLRENKVRRMLDIAV
jgi:hypothetical protein